MILKLRNLFVLATALSAVGVATRSESASPDSFDTVAFLQACSDLVPNVDYALPMDVECISQSHRLCELADPSAEAEKCVSVVSKWMRDETISKWSQIPEKLRLGYGHPPAAQELARDAMRYFDNELLAQFAPNIPDCEDVQVQGVSEQVICGYADAMAGWLALRELQRAAERAEE